MLDDLSELMLRPGVDTLPERDPARPWREWLEHAAVALRQALLSRIPMAPGWPPAPT